MHTEDFWECLSYQASVSPKPLSLSFGAPVQCEGARPGPGAQALRFGTHAYAFQVYGQSPDIVPQARSSAVNSVSILAPHNAEPWHGGEAGNGELAQARQRSRDMWPCRDVAQALLQREDFLAAVFFCHCFALAAV